jgi:hypothetical protein
MKDSGTLGSCSSPAGRRYKYLGHSHFPAIRAKIAPDKALFNMVNIPVLRVFIAVRVTRAAADSHTLDRISPLRSETHLGRARSGRTRHTDAMRDLPIFGVPTPVKDSQEFRGNDGMTRQGAHPSQFCYSFNHGAQPAARRTIPARFRRLAHRVAAGVSGEAGQPCAA